MLEDLMRQLRQSHGGLLYTIPVQNGNMLRKIKPTVWRNTVAQRTLKWTDNRGVCEAKEIHSMMRLPRAEIRVW